MRASLILVVFAFVCVPLLAQPSEEERRLRMAEGYERAGDMQSAARVFRELLEGDPASDAYFEGVQRTFQSLGWNAELLPYVQSRVDQRPGEFLLRISLADLLFRVGRRPEAVVEWNRSIESGTGQEFVFAIVAASQIDNRAYDLAVQTYRGARMRLGDPTAFGDQLAQLLMISGRYEEATREYVDMLFRDPNRLSLTMRGLSEATANSAGTQAAIRVVEDALRRRPSYQPLLELLSWLHTESGDDRASFDVARRLDEARGSHGSNIFAFADRALRGGRHDAAIEALIYFEEQFGEQSPLYGSAMLLHATALEERAREAGKPDRKELAAVADRYRAVARRSPGTPDAAQALLRAAIILAEDLDDGDEATDLLEDIGASNAPPSIRAGARLLHGNLLLASGRLEEARRAYADVRHAVHDGGDDARAAAEEAALREAESLLYEGQLKAGVDSLTSITRNPSSAVANDALTLLFLMQENFGRNDTALVTFLRARYLVLQRRYNDALEAFAEAARLSRGGSLAEEARYRSALAQHDAGDSEAALQALVQLVSEIPEGLFSDRALMSAAEIADREINDRERALQLYMRVLSEYPTSPAAANARKRAAELRDR